MAGAARPTYNFNSGSSNMRQIVYTMHFRGQAAPTAIDPKVLRATSSATSCTVSTTIRTSGLATDVKAGEGDLAFFESEMRLTGPDSFEETGTISFGDETDHLLHFSTLGHGHLTPSLEPGTMAGTISWKVEGGAGQFAGARGLTTSTFVLTDSGDLSDFHSGLIFLPD
mgnify:CR=1 FL=1